MNRILKILCGVACAFAFCFLAIGYAAIQDELLVNGSVSVKAQNKVFAVYGEVFDSNDISQGYALNFYNRPIVAVGDTIDLISDDGTMTTGTQTVEEIYVDFDTVVYTANTQLPWYKKDIETVTVVDEGIAPVSTAYWFYHGTYLLKSINDIGKLDTSNVTSMKEMFRNCNKLTSLDVSGLETGNVTDMSGMFRNCNQLTELIFGDFDTSNVQYMHDMFLSCSSLSVLDLSSFNTSSVVQIGAMFNGCNASTVYVSELWSIASNVSLRSEATNANGSLFNSTIIGGAGTTYGSDGLSYARIDGGSTAPGYFTYYKYAVVFEPNHETASGEVVATVPELILSTNNTFTIPEAPTHKWATFLGWAITATVDDNTHLYQPGDTFTSSTTAPCCDVLYAIWDLGVTNLTELNDEIANGVGETNEDPLVIGGGYWSEQTELTVTHKTLAIYDGNFDSIERLDGSNVTIYGGQFNFYYMWMQGATVTIKDGSFTNANGFINPGNGASTLIIEGGNFSWTVISNSDICEVIITGGTFSFNPSAYVSTGYKVNDNGDGTWTVVAE